MKTRPKSTGFKAFLSRSVRYVFAGVPVKTTCVKIAQINYGGILKGTRVIITGGNRGLGFAFARKCLDEGAKVVITGRSREKLDDAIARLGSPDCFAIEHDVRRVGEAPALMAKAGERLGGFPNALVNNAGLSLHENSYATCTEQDWDAQVDTNLKGTFFMCQAFASQFLKQAGPNPNPAGNIVILTSERGLTGDDIPYGLTKAALINFTYGLAKRLISQGIRVNAIAPGVTATDMTGYDSGGNLYRPYARGRRVLLGEEIAETLAFLLSDASRCISGQVLVCNETNHLK